MANKKLQNFGGQWTSEKIEALGRYLKEYLKIIKKRNFRSFYIDAFAGTGYINLRKSKDKSESQLSLIELNDPSYERMIDGSVKVALSLEKEFDYYIFIEKEKEKIDILQNLLDRCEDKKNKIRLINGDCNNELLKICKFFNQHQSYRGVLFLDPFGMSVKWDTIKAIADTKKFDVWMLVPLGIGAGRLLTNQYSKITVANKNKLNEFFGTQDWEDCFYKENTQLNLFNQKEKVKYSNYDKLENFYFERLKSVFAAVSPYTYRMINSKNSTLFSLYFAVSNPNAIKVSLKIAEHILKNNINGSKIIN